MKRVIYMFITLVFMLTLIGPVSASESNLILVEDGVWYEKNTQMFVYAADNNELVRISVCDGMITTKMVSVLADSIAKLRIYRNGELLDSEIYRQLGEAGEYVVLYEVFGEEKRIASFTIIPAVTNNMLSYHMPAGFKITQVSLDNLPIDFEPEYIRFDAEGDYRVLYRCVRTGMDYSLNFTTDFTGPVLKLEGVEDGIARRGVNIYDAEEAYSVQIFKDGRAIPYDDNLTASGKYLIVLTDSTGNVTNYEFTILVHFNAFWLLVISAVIVTIAALVAYAIWSRKKFTVR